MLLINKLTLFLMLCLSAYSAQAADNNEKQRPQAPIDIKAQYLLLDESKGISKYKGNVVFTKGTLVIQADAITLYSDGGKLSKAIITGSPADVQHQPENEEKVHSQANKMQYIMATEQLTLTGNAFVDQGEQHFSGNIIKYDTRQRLVTASGNKPNLATQKKDAKNPASGRVHVIIGPENSHN